MFKKDKKGAENVENLFCKKNERGNQQLSNKRALKNMDDPDVNNNFVGAFPANLMNKFIDHKLMISEKKGEYPFLIANTDASSKKGTHW